MNPKVPISNGNQVTLAVTPQLVEQESYYTGLASYGEYVKLSPAQTIVCAFKEVGYWIEIVIESLGMMFTGQVGINDLTAKKGSFVRIKGLEPPRR